MLLTDVEAKGVDRGLNIVVASNAYYDLKRDPTLMQQLVASQVSFLYFLKFWRFQVPESGQVLNLGNELWPGQLEFVSAAQSYQRLFALKARKLGFTTLETAFDAWCARFRDPQGRVHLFSRTDPAACDLLERVRFGMDRLPSWMQLPTDKSNMHQHTLRAGADDLRTIEAYPTSGTTATENVCTHAHIDEMWLMTDPKKVWQSVEPTAQGTTHIITTGRGPTGWMAELWKRSLVGDSTFFALFVPALARPDRDMAFMQEKAAALGGWDAPGFRQEYALTWEDALFGGGDFVFDRAQLDWASSNMPKGPHIPEDEHVYVKAWDIGRHKDAAVNVVLDVTEDVHEVVHYERWRQCSYPVLQRHIERVHREYPGVTVIEDNAAGEAVRENLPFTEDDGVIGFKTTPSSKPRILEYLRIGFEHQLLMYSADAWPQLDTELRAYQWDDKLLTQDSVVALAIAREHAPLAFRYRRPGNRGRLRRLIRF